MATTTSGLIVPGHLVDSARHRAEEMLKNQNVELGVKIFDEWVGAPEIPASIIDGLRQFGEGFQKKFRLGWNGWARYWYCEDFYKGKWEVLFRFLKSKNGALHPMPLDGRIFDFMADRYFGDTFPEWQKKFENMRAQKKKAKDEKETEIHAEAVEATERAVADATSFENGIERGQKASLDIVDKTLGGEAAARAEIAISGGIKPTAEMSHRAKRR